jgi:hypothetical protein
MQLLAKLLRSRLRHRHSSAAAAACSTRSTLGQLVLAAAAELELLALAWHSRVGGGAPQPRGLAGLFQLHEDSVQIHLTGHRHLPLQLLYAD